MKKTNLKSVLKTAVKISATNSANSTTSGTIFQPKAPAALKKFSKIDR
jgi:cyclic lactone autoinducer peptide